MSFTLGCVALSLSTSPYTCLHLYINTWGKIPFWPLRWVVDISWWRKHGKHRWVSVLLIFPIFTSRWQYKPLFILPPLPVCFAFANEAAQQLNGAVAKWQPTTGLSKTTTYTLSPLSSTPFACSHGGCATLRAIQKQLLGSENRL